MSIRSRLRAWLGITNPAAPPAAQDVAPGLKIDPSALYVFGATAVVRRPVESPKLFRGVVPEAGSPELAADDACGARVAFDSETLAPVWAWSQQANCGLGFPGYPYLAELAQRSEYRAPAETIASELTREWIVVKTKGKTSEGDDSDGKRADDAALADGDAPVTTGGSEDKIEDIVAALDKFGVREHIRKIAELDGFFGRAQLFIDIDSGSKLPDEIRKLPLLVDPETIKQGTLRGFKVIEPMWTTPYSFNATDPTAADFYVPRAWYVLGKKIHASRLLTFISREVPDILKPAYNFGGLSLSQLMEPYVFQWLRTRNSVSDLIHNFSIISLATNMQTILQGDAGAAKGLLDRATLFTQTRDNQGLMLVDKDTEVLAQLAVPLSSLDALQAQAQEHMAAPSHIPLVKLLGVTPTGLNASSEGEIKVFYDFVRALQQSFISKHLKTIIDIIQLHLFGEIDDAITFEFVPLTAPTVKELAEIRKSDAENGVRYIEAGVIGPDEERERLMSDPNSGYLNLTGPAPEPPPTPGLDPETGAPLKGGPFADAPEPPPGGEK